MEKKWNEAEKEGYRLIHNEGGKDLGISSGSKVTIITEDGFAFKDFLGTGELAAYEDWRLPAAERAADLASRLSIEDIAGLMLYSAHQLIPARGPLAAAFGGTYGGKAFDESGADPWDLTDQQKEFIVKDRVRHVLIMKLQDTEDIPYEDFVDLNILVVDDDQVICESTCILLSELGMKGEWVVSGRAAVDQVELRYNSGRDYFAVLLDWKMPDMDGIATTREIRRRVGDHVPIIIISAYDWSAIEKEARMAGANGFIGKPLFKSRLVHLFGQLLNHEMEENGPGLRELTEQTDFSGKRVLLAEDNEINAEIAMEVLSMLGLAAEWAHDGKEAVDCMKTSPSGYYDCVFMDVQMPVMNGLDAAKAIRDLPHPDAKTIPIFAMTANAMAEDVKAVLAAGMNEHIAKPLDFRVLMNVLNKYLR